MRLRTKLAAPAIVIAILVSSSSSLFAQPQTDDSAKIEQLQNSIAQLQAELQQMRANPAPGDTQLRHRPSADLLPPPTNPSAEPAQAANQAPTLGSLGPAPGQIPGQTQSKTQPVWQTSPPISPTLVQPIVPQQAPVVIELVPVYRPTYYRPPYGGYSGEYSCPYRSYRPIYADYDYFDLYWQR